MSRIDLHTPPHFRNYPERKANVDEVEKLRVLIPHWIEHNEEHASELQRWAGLTTEASQDILTAAESMMRVNRALATALERLGGPTTSQHIQE
jgi:hypothetical protein